MLSHLRRYFISGLLVLLPIWVTVLLLGFFTGILDSTLSLLPLEWQPDTILGFHLPGLGAIVIFVAHRLEAIKEADQIICLKKEKLKMFLTDTSDLFTSLHRLHQTKLMAWI